MNLHQEFLVNDYQFQNAIWFHLKLDIFDCDEIFLESDTIIGFDKDTVILKNGFYLRELCHFSLSLK